MVSPRVSLICWPDKDSENNAGQLERLDEEDNEGDARISP